jgi:hypothetical protein
MSQPGLMKIHRTFIDKTCLSSDVASITFTYFLNSAHTSLKYAIQFLLIQNPQNPLQTLKKLVLVSQVNPFEFFFDCRKQVQVTSGQIRWIGLVWHVVNAIFFELICWTPTCMNRATLDRNHQSFCMRCPSSRKDHLFEGNKYICHKIIDIHFGIIWKSVDNIEPSRIPDNREHKLFALTLLSRFYGHIISR